MSTVEGSAPPAAGPAATMLQDVHVANVLVPLDGSETAAAAMTPARALAARFGATLHALSVANTPEGATAARDIAARALAVDPADARVHVVVAHRPAAAIRAEADELGSCLVCMATHGRTGLQGALTGSFAREVFEHLPTPVVVVGPEARAAGKRAPTSPSITADHLVACVDGTPASEHAVAVAAAWARRLGMRLTVVTVAEPCPPPLRLGAAWARHHGPDRDVDDYLDELRERWTATFPGLATEAIYDPISPGAGVQHYLRDRPTSLVVVTTHSRTGLDRLGLGGGAASIIHRASVPVLVVPAPA